ncbi:MAG TPA: ABC transporter permease, partial [Propionibacteriaceae bacterium]|nr:ABC transporter permease [Propionibacteriaceae bacterium]
MRRAGLWTGLVLVALVLLAALVSLVWTPYNPLQVQPSQTLRPAGWPHVLGTDGFGIDILSRLLVGARTTVYVGVVAVSLAALGGVPLG